MVIDKIGNINNIVDTRKTKSSGGVSETRKNDSIQISSEGKKAAETARISQIVRETPDVRAERVAEIKDKIARGEYNFDDNKILEMVADKIADSLLR